MESGAVAIIYYGWISASSSRLYYATTPTIDRLQLVRAQNSKLEKNNTAMAVPAVSCPTALVMLGGIHLEDSGWTSALIQAEIASSGTAASFLKAAHLTRTRHGHQVCALVLSKLQQYVFLSSEALHDEEYRGLETENR